ncbi:hypothetical protein [Calothrix sp. NIES-2098]|uniref:hypothetical protein n=1 Tax=Calothrix sp. NIES-2098 TaxID=1954171 RepID=UPI000B5E9AFA|nr:hypothetical protein NIES2098_18160 [Calothrix sp. NIES-2098]
MDWIQAEEWWLKYKNYEAVEDRANPTHFFEQEFTVDISLAELQKIIPVPPVSNPTDTSEPGTCERWYGQINELIFWLTYYHTESNNYTLISCMAPPSPRNYHWSFLEKLVALPSSILSKISWIKGYDNAETSIYTFDKYGLTYEFYRAKTHLEAIELITFLQRIKSELNFYIDEPENRNSTWVAVKIQPGEAEQIVARYNSRSSTESVAKAMSMNDDALYQVNEERVGGKIGLAFVKGKVIKTPC